MNKLHHNKYYNHPLIKYVNHKHCKQVYKNGKQILFEDNLLIHNIGCLLKNKIKFMFDTNIIKINKNLVYELYTFNKTNNKFFLNKNMIYNLKIAEILNIKYILQSNNTCILFYEKNKLNSIFFLFIRSKLEDILEKTKIIELNIYNFYYSYLNGYSEKLIKMTIKSGYIMNIPKHLGYNTWLKKNYNLKEEFSYKNDYNRRHKFIFSKQNEKYFDNKYENIKKKLMKIYNNSISSSEFDKFYKKQLKNVKDYKFLKKDVIQYLVNNEDIKNFNKYLSDLDVEVKKLN